MTLSINTNIASVQAARALAANRDNMETTMQRLSTGKRINSTLDDASGLAVANRMRNQIAGLNMAIRNANDGISLAQTAEGSMEALQNVLLRMRELATQASNGTYTADDRSYMAAEFDELMREIRRVSNHAAWDGDVKLIAEGSKPHQFQVGIDSADYIQVPLRSLAVEDLNLSNKATLTSSKGSAVEAFKFHDLSTLSKPAVTFAPADWGGTDKSELTDVRFIDNPRPNFELRLWNGSRDSDGNPEGLASSVNILSVTGAGSVQDLITQLKAHPNYDSTVADITFSNGEMRVIWKVAGQPDPASQLVVTNPVDRGNAVAIPAGTSSVNHGADLVESVESDPINYPAHYQQEFNLSKVVFHRDTVPKSAGNFFAIQIGSRTLTADNVANAADLAAKFKQDSDYSFIREKIGLGSSKLELFEVIDVPAGKANVSGSAITQLKAQSTINDVYTNADGKTYKVNKSTGTDTYAGNVSGNPKSQSRIVAAEGEIYNSAAIGAPAVYKIKGSGLDDTTDGAALTLAPGDETLLTNALASARVQKLKINFGKDSTERGFMYQSTHNVTISDPESAVSALDFVDAATRTVSESRSRMGAVMSGIEFTINNLMNVVENTEEAKSRVLDTDYAKESAELAKAQILAQAGTAMLAQANQSQQYVLNLLRQG
jgi:flagellin